MGGTDGVSLEIEKRMKILQDEGGEVLTLAGEGQGVHRLLPLLHFDRPAIRQITYDVFESRYSGHQEELFHRIQEEAANIMAPLEVILAQLRPDYLFLHNIFSHGRHLPAALAFYQILKERPIPTLATHHDFYWEREHFHLPPPGKVRELVEQILPPVLPQLHHGVINSMAQKELLKRGTIKAQVFPDTLDFHASPWQKDSWNSHLPAEAGFHEKDIIILQSTRIVPRKGIEMMIPILEALNQEPILSRLRGRTLYNGKKITSESRFHFLLAGYAEKESQTYKQTLQKRLTPIPHSFLDSMIERERRVKGGKRFYSLFDAYPFADLFSYPSLHEGWGNQFLEAIFARLPILLFEYPVYKADIKEEGYEVLSLGDQAQKDDLTGLYSLPDSVVNTCVEEVVRVLLQSETAQRIERNAQRASTHHGKDTLQRLLHEAFPA